MWLIGAPVRLMNEINNQSIQGIMKMEELDNLNRDELFAVIKEKCISRAKREVYLGLVFLVILILFIIWAVKYYPHSSFIQYDPKDGIVFLVYLIACFCLGGWIILYNYRLGKKIATLDTPEQLLNCYEKRERHNKIFSYINSCVLLLFVTYPLVRGGSTIFLIGVAVLVILFAIFLTSVGIYVGRMNHRDKLLEKLQDLVEE